MKLTFNENDVTHNVSKETVVETLVAGMLEDQFLEQKVSSLIAIVTILMEHAPIEALSKIAAYEGVKLEND